MAEHELDLLDMPAFLDAVAEELPRARRRILVETYIIRDDRLGRTLAEQMLAAVRRGVDARLLYDPHGSIEAPRALFRELSRGGVLTRPYRRLGAVLGRFSPAVRDHSRMLVIDDAAYTGGHAWGAEWLPRQLGGGGWHDLSVRARGPVLEDFVDLFGQRWRESEGLPPVARDTGDRYPDVRLVSCGPYCPPLLLRALLEAFGAARHRIWIENAYFFPSVPLLRALTAATERGVDVRVILPANGDVRIIARAARAEYRNWLDAGMKILEYVPVVSHGKAALVDDDWATVGSFNANPCSGRLSIELGLVIRERRFVASLAHQLAADMALSRRVTAPRRPGPLEGLAHAALALCDGLLA
jgi:cardiolipin synthase A/B